MAKLFGFFVFTFVILQTLSFMMDGEFAFQQTTLTAAIGPTQDASISVADTSGFLLSDYIIIDGEIIHYTGMTDTAFTGITRAALDSEASQHGADTVVYSETSGYINQVIGFNVLQTISNEGLITGVVTAVVQLPTMFKNIIGKLIIWDFRFLDGHGAILRLPLWALSGTLVMSFIGFVFGRSTA